MKPSENLAIIDIGSNSIRLLIGNFHRDKINKLHTDREITRLGKDLLTTKKLNPESIEKSIQIINSFKEKSEQYNAKLIIPIGTSALREAEDSFMFCNKVKKTTGLEIKIISGEQEAYYTLEGINIGLPKYKDFIAIDIGGGSSEWIFKNQKNEIFKGSLNLGTLKVNKKFNMSHFQNYLNSLINKNIPQKIKCKKMIATGGTAVTLAMIDLKVDNYIPDIIHGHIVSCKKLKEIIKQLLETSVKERINIVGIPSDRVDIIIPGLIILNSLTQFFDSESIIISDYGFLEGVMKNYKSFCYN